MRKRILVVDSSPASLRLIALALEVKDYEVITAADGVEGLRMAQQGAPDLLILDVMLPEMDGFEVCHQLRSHRDHSLARLPILMLTARSQGLDPVRAEEVSVDSYLPKDVLTREELTEAVGALLAQREEQRV